MEAMQAKKRISLSNILVATDFSGASEVSLHFAVAFAKLYDAQIVVAYAISPEPHLAVTLDPLPLEADRVWQDAASRLSGFAGSELLTNIPHKEILERGDVWDVISKIVEKDKIDLIVAGTHGRHGLQRLVMGSNAEKIYRRANCPVLTVGPNVHPLYGEDWKLKRILFPTDGSEASLAALPHALSLAEENQTLLIFLRLMPIVPPEYREGEEASIREELRTLVAAEARVLNPEFEVRSNFPAEGILRLAGEREVDLIVMGVRKSSDRSISDHLPWPVASQVAAEAPCPVLTVRG
jgi:nucleotide-binding universal stress UspA family protein